MATSKQEFVGSVVGRMVGEQSHPARKARPAQPAKLTEAALLKKMTPDDWRDFQHLKAGVSIARQRAAQRKAAEAARLYAELVAMEKEATE